LHPYGIGRGFLTAYRLVGPNRYTEATERSPMNPPPGVWCFAFPSTVLAIIHFQLVHQLCSRQCRL
jgi:hypothetical protein